MCGKYIIYTIIMKLLEFEWESIVLLSLLLILNMADADGMEDNVCDGTIHPDKESDGQTNISTLHQTSESDDTKIGQSTEEGEATKGWIVPSQTLSSIPSASAIFCS
jgi:hypothetical protein